jgi:hypothetical protein
MRFKKGQGGGSGSKHSSQLTAARTTQHISAQSTKPGTSSAVDNPGS